MNSRYLRLQEWVNARNKRESLLLVLLGCLLTYALWYFLISRSMVAEESELTNQIIVLKTKIKAAQQESENIINVAKHFSTNQKLEINKMLSLQSESLQKSIEGSTVSLNSQKNIENLVREILNQPEKGMALLDIKNLGDEPLIATGTDITTLPPILKNISKHGLQVIIRSDYFNTIHYLTLLEKLPWRLYWDSLEYRVVNYPQAEITIKFYVLMNTQTNENNQS